MIKLPFSANGMGRSKNLAVAPINFSGLAREPDSKLVLKVEAFFLGS